MKMGGSTRKVVLVCYYCYFNLLCLVLKSMEDQIGLSMVSIVLQLGVFPGSYEM